MIGALWTGISGLSSQQKALDNESNNIANVNTIGFKASRISFADQMYQDRIGKGSKILDSEKLYTQGNLKLTGVNYDMALSGDGFFTVVNTRSSGAAETLYTRAGNFRMGDNGTLQDAAGNEVQGWMMTAIDSQNDVTSTNPNVTVFNTDYTKLMGSKIIRHSTYVETITAKATDYTTTAKSDSSTVFTGDGGKTKSSKISDIEEAIKDYTSWLQKLKDEPDASSASSIAQVSQVNFKSGADSIINKDGDQIYIYIDGNKISQNYLLTTANQDFKVDLYNNAGGAGAGFVDPANLTNIIPPAITNVPGGLNQTQIDAANAIYDKAASKIATYKALSDKISQIPGLVANMAIDSGKADVFNTTTTYINSTKNADMLKGIIQIKSLIPGKEFVISEVSEQSGNTINQGNYQNSALASKGSGIGALATSKDALSKLISGKQQDVYTMTNLGIGTSAGNYSYGITIYDKDLKINTPIPNNGLIPPVSVPVIIENGNSVDEIVTQLNANSELSAHVTAKNVNGNLVIETKDSNYDVEFTGNIKQLPSVRIDLNEVVDNADYSFNININGTPTTFSLSAGVPSIVNPNTLTQAQIYGNIKTKIDTYNLNPLNTDKLGITPLNSTGRFSVYTIDQNVSFAGSTVGISGEVLPSTPLLTASANTDTTLAESTIGIIPADNTTYSFDILGETVSYTSGTGATSTSIYNGLISSINTKINLSGLISVGTLSGNNFDISQLSLQNTASPAGLGISNLTGLTASADGFIAGTAQTHTFTPVLANPNSASVFTLTVEGIDLKVRTDQTPTVQELQASLNIELAKNPTLAAQITITDNGTSIIITEKIDAQGYQGFTLPSSLIPSSLTITGDEFKTVSTTVSEITPIDVNSNYSGRKGAGAEFIEIINKVDQTASKGGLQLRLDTLGISDSAFGEFSVDSTGLITMKQDGAQFAVGQVSIAVFNNNRGLEPMGDNLLGKTNESGDPIYNLNNNKTAKVESKTLELSTADLSESLVNLMVFQRAFEANAKSITTSDELLNTLINLKR